MPPLATVPDVESRWRPLTTDEAIVAATRIDDASAEVRTAVPSVDQKIDDDEVGTYAQLVTRVVVDMVLRVLKNPDGYNREQDGDYGYGLAAGAASGTLELLPSERRRLSGRQQVGSVALVDGALPAPTVHPSYPLRDLDWS